MTTLFTVPQEMFFVILTLGLFAALIGDFRNARLFRLIGKMPDTRKGLDKATKLFMILLVVFMAWAQDKDSQQSSTPGDGDWLSGSTLESMEGGRYSMAGGESSGSDSAAGRALVSGDQAFADNAVLTASQYLAGSACVGVTNILPSALEAPSNAVAYTDWPYAVARHAVLLPQGCLPEGFTFGGRTVTNLYAAASGMLSFDGQKSSPTPSTNGIPDGTAVNYISVLQTPSDIVPTNGLFWYAIGTNSSVFTWKDVFLGQDTNCLATVQAELFASGDFTCRYYFPSLTNNYAQLTNAFLIGAQNNSGGETVLYTNDLLSIHPSFLPAFELQWKSLAGLSPEVPDRDSDGLSDADELFICRTDPRSDDTDGDGIPDGAEIANGTDPLNPDENNDGIPDGIDLTGYSLSDTNLVFKLINGIAPGVDPLLDSDNDGWADWLELRFGTNPNYAFETPEGWDNLFSVTVTLASPPTEPGVLAVGGSRVLVSGPGSWVFWRTPGEAHPVSFTSAHGVPPPFTLSFNRPDAARYNIPAPDGKGGDFGKAALPLISFDPAISRCCHEIRTEEYCQTYTAYVMPPMPGTYDWQTYAWDYATTWITNAANALAVGHDISWMRLRFTPSGASAYREDWVWVNTHCSKAGIETNNLAVVSVNNNDDDADETRDDTDTEITGGDPDLAELWPLGRFDGLCCLCPSHHPLSDTATLAASSQKLALYTDSYKTNAYSGTVHAGDAVYVEGLAPSTEPYAEKLVWQWTEDNETKSLTNALTVLSVRLFPDLDTDDDVDASDIAGLASLSSEYGWLMPASTNVFRKLRLRTDVGLSGGAYTLTLSGDAGAFKVWADNSDTNTAPLLVCGQTVTNGVGGVTFLAGEDTDLYVEAAGPGVATITYTYAGEGGASNIACFAELGMAVPRAEITIADPDEPSWPELAEGKVILSDKDMRIRIRVFPSLPDLETIFGLMGTSLYITTSATKPDETQFTLNDQNAGLVQGQGCSELRVSLSRGDLQSLEVLPSQESDSVFEKAWMDTGYEDPTADSNLTDGNAFDTLTAENRGKSTRYGNLSSASINRPLNDTFFQAAGSEIFICRYNDSLSPKRQVMNQADYFYYSGHGGHLYGSLMYGSPAQVTNYWSADLECVIIAGCSVLDINDYNNHYTGDDHIASPGKKWEQTAPTVLLGYNYFAPLDSQGSALIVASWLSNRTSLGDIDAWMNANDNTNGRNACAIQKDVGYYYFHRSGFYPFYQYTKTFVEKSTW